MVLTALRTHYWYSSYEMFFSHSHICSLLTAQYKSWMLGQLWAWRFLRWQAQNARSWKGAQHFREWEMKSLQEDMAATLLTVMLMITYISEGGETSFHWNNTAIYQDKMQTLWFHFGNEHMLPFCVIALLRKSTASDFLQKIREKRASECFPGGCSTEVIEVGELLEVDVGYVSSDSLLRKLPQKIDFIITVIHA